MRLRILLYTHDDERILCPSRLVSLTTRFAVTCSLVPRRWTIRLSLISHSSTESCPDTLALECFSIFRILSLGETLVSEISGSTYEFFKAGRRL